MIKLNYVLDVLSCLSFFCKGRA